MTGDSSSVGAVLRPAHHPQLPDGQGLGLVAALAGHQAKPQELEVCRDQGDQNVLMMRFL